MNKSRAFSIYLLKEGGSAENALKSASPLVAVSSTELPDKAFVYILNNFPTQPWWKSYWGISESLTNVLKGAIVFLSVDSRCFALTFGHTYHYLKDESYEYDFGLITTLNALDPEKIKSTDIFQPENSKRERIQSPNASDLNYFDINKDESIIKRLTGAVKDEYKEFLSNITGANNLKITSRVSAKEMEGLCRRILRIYNKEDFKKSFPEIQNISPVKDPAVIKRLNDKLLDAFNSNSIDLVLTVPDILDYQEVSWFSYRGAGRSSSKFDNAYIFNYRDYLQEKNLASIDIDMLKKHKLNLLDDNNNILRGYPIYKCLLFDCDIRERNIDEHYHLCEGEWYRIEKDYIKRLKDSLDPLFIDYASLIDCNQKREDDYNFEVSSMNESLVCLDKKNIALKGNVEPCDLYTVENETVVLIHNKISTRSFSLSHLFNQGINSIKMLRTSIEARNKLKELLPSDSFRTPIDNDKFRVVYGIITAKNKSKKSDNLPIFSKISLQRIINELRLMGIEGQVVLIKDLVDRKK